MLIAFVLFLPKGIAPLLLRLFCHDHRVEAVETAPQTGQASAQATA